MCGIFGLHSFFLDKHEKITASKNAIKLLNPRGPDFNDLWICNDENLIFSHNRLSILDLSEKGNQPMLSKTKNLVIVFNGEIYNHLYLRKKIYEENNFNEWNGTSDTETLLQSIEFWGIEKTLQEINGMFSFAVWDKKKKILYLSRDRFGEKPLYYGWINQNKSFVFGSELIFDKLFKNIEFLINENALKDLLYLNYVNKNYSIFKNIFKVSPGHYLKIYFRKDSYPEIVEHCYWNAKEILSNRKIFQKEENLKNDLDSILSDVVNKQKLADVEVGTFLSGGIDSTLITSKLQEVSIKKVKTFTIGNENKEYDESKYARQVANYLNTDHEELILSDKIILDKIPNILSLLNEPLGDSSFIPTYFVSKLAKEKVKVVLTGDGGDEIFGGYNRYTKLKMMSNLYKIPKPLKSILFNILSKLSQKNVEKFIKIIPQFKNEFYLKDKIKKIIDRLDPNLSYNKYLLSFLLNNFNHNIFLNLSPNPKESILNKLDEILVDENLQSLSIQERMMYLDTQNYLTNDILFKVDRASMSNSLETRAPFLDKDIFNFSSSLPLSKKIKNGKGKKILRELLKDKIPSGLVDRPKAGFSIPIGDWIKGPLIDWSEDLLSKNSVEKSGYLNFKNVEKIWKNHKNGYDNSNLIWSILVFQQWLKNR